MVEKDAPEIVPPEKQFEVEECVVGSEPLDNDCWMGGKNEMNEEDELCKESHSEVNTCQEIRTLHTELQSFKSETQKVVKSLRERVRELEAELDSDCSCQEHVQADALALQAELDGLCLQQAKQAQQGLSRTEKKVRASKRWYGKMKEKHKELHEVNTHLNSLVLSLQAAEQTSVTA